MQNTRTFEGRIDLWACAEGWSDGEVTAKGDGALALLSEALEAYGMSVTTTREGRYATIKIDHLQPWEAERARTRRAGRPRTKGTSWPAEMGGSDEERLVWCAAHTIDEVAETLGCSRRTAQRRVSELRKKA